MSLPRTQWTDELQSATHAERHRAVRYSKNQITWTHLQGGTVRTPVATNATIDIGTSRVGDPSGPRYIGKRPLNRSANDETPPVKKRSWITAMIR